MSTNRPTNQPTDAIGGNSQQNSQQGLLHQPARAVYWLRKAAETGWPCYPYFAANLDNIRSDPGVVAFMEQLKVRWEHYRATL